LSVHPCTWNITAILGLRGGQNLLLDVLCINTDKNVKTPARTGNANRQRRSLGSVLQANTLDELFNELWGHSLVWCPR
jgi:hypothetical protein